MRRTIGKTALGLCGFILSATVVSAAPPAAAPDNNDRIASANKQAVDDARHGRYMAATYGYLAAAGVSDAQQIADDDAYDQWAQAWSTMTGVHIMRKAKPADYPVSAAEVAALKAARGRDAISEIVARARKTRIVIVDEGHLDPRDRSFGLQVARALRPLGYKVLAVETLTHDPDDAVSRAKMDKLSADGYLRHSSGYYTDDPVFSDFLRQSMALGYRLVSYESSKFFKVEDPEEQGAVREQEQAELIIKRGLEKDPHAKVLIYCGIHHAAKGELALEAGKHRAWMAMRLQKMTGIDPLVVDQATLEATPAYKPDVDLYALAAPKTKGRSVVLMNGNKPVSVGMMAGVVDLQVVHPRVPRQYGRPGWMSIMGRKPRAVPKSLLPKTGVRLIQAYIAHEADDTVPVDQVLVTAGQPAPKLLLPKGRIRYAVQDWPPAR